MKALSVLLAVLTAAPAAGLAANAAQPTHGPWTTGDCVNTTIDFFGPRLDMPHGTPAQLRNAIQESGIHIDYATHHWDRHHWEPASVLYQGEDELAVAARQRLGDKVQMCFISSPQKTAYCDPVADPRGIIFRIYNYRLRAEFRAPNSQHGCGGA